MPLIEGLKNEVICRENVIRGLIPLQLTPYDDAVRRSLAAEKLHSRGNTMSVMIDLMEGGLLPDTIIRRGIRRMLRNRLQDSPMCRLLPPT